MKRLLPALLSVIIVLCGCSALPFMSKDAPALETKEVSSPDDFSDTYLAVEYNGRTFVPYGALSGTMTGQDAEKCVGYVKNPEDSGDTSSRVLTLKGTADYIAIVSDGTMNQTVFLRAADTRGEDIFTPDIITPLDCGYWRVKEIKDGVCWVN